jgi:hypothetical protein
VDFQSLNGGFTGNPTVNCPHFHRTLFKRPGKTWGKPQEEKRVASNSKIQQRRFPWELAPDSIKAVNGTKKSTARRNRKKNDSAA